MPFPKSHRIIYNKNPLKKVICQLRFPPILKIEKELPADFQELIRKDFPIYSESTEFSYDIPQKNINMEKLAPETFKKLLFQPPLENKNYAFSSEDGIWKINLTRTFIALSAEKYERWEKFIAKLSLPLKAFIDIYDPAYFSRVGLRYIDVISRVDLGIEGHSWDELIQPYILGMLSSKEIKENIENFESQYSIKLNDNKGNVRILTKFYEGSKDEQCYMIDSDFSNDSKIDRGHEIEYLNYFNKRGSRLIQWCIKKTLHEAMEPKEIC
jgi:uncharacterized protein (TIGR04255 family)